MADFVGCITLDGSIKQVRKEEMIIRPAVFAIMQNGNKLLTLTLRASGKYHLPGGGVELGEWLEQTLKREVLEETGITIVMGELAFFEELFFYYDPSGNAYHGLHFYFHCTPQSTQLLSDDQVNDGSAERPCWTPINELTADQFQSSGQKIISACNID